MSTYIPMVVPENVSIVVVVVVIVDIVSTRNLAHDAGEVSCERVWDIPFLCA